MKKQTFNPFLPLWECIPDGEPHVFGDRVYLYGSHDKMAGDTFCAEPYTVWSAPIHDLSDWSYRGVSYRAEQDSNYSAQRPFMFAPDCVQGNDGRFYLYYCLAGYHGDQGYSGPVSVAVCDTPDGEFSYYGFVKNPDGSEFQDYVLFDPAVMNDEGTIRLYFGTDMGFANYPWLSHAVYLWKHQCERFNRTLDEVKRGVTGAFTVELDDDMLTVKGHVKRILPTKTRGTAFSKHPFFEASSIRKIGDLYYFVYSSLKNHELCYATSPYPDRDFQFRGVIVSNGDIGFHGRKPKDRLNHTGNNHGGLVCIEDQWYIFYHRPTHGTDFSRQACAEAIEILPDGTIAQVEMTSCGLNGKPLADLGTYPAAICCNLTNGQMPHGGGKKSFPKICWEEELIVTGITCGTVIGYKYFDFQQADILAVITKGSGEGFLEVRNTMDGTLCGKVPVQVSDDWQSFSAPMNFAPGKQALYLRFMGEGSLKICAFTLSKGASHEKAGI